MEITKFGMRLKRSLPVTIDSLMGVERRSLENDEIASGQFCIARPAGAYGSLWRRSYHAWLVLTNRAMATQFTRDHFEMAGVKTLPKMARPPEVD